MPNHCANELIVKGPADQVSAFRERAKADKCALDLNNFIPMPQELRDEVVEPIHDKERWNALNEKYGTANGSVWGLNNWGTKWGAYDVEVTDEGNGYVTYLFYTAWGPFDQHVLAKMSEEYPDLLLNLVFAERLMDFWGAWDAMRGEIVGESAGEEVDSLSTSGVYGVANENAPTIHRLADISG